MLNNGQPESEATPTLHARVRLSEAFKHPWKKFRCDTLAPVSDLHLGTRFHPTQGDSYLLALGAKLDRVFEQVADTFSKPLRIARHRDGIGFYVRYQRDLLGFRDRGHQFDRRVDYKRKIHRSAVKLQLAGNDPGGIDHVIDHVAKRPNREIDSAKPLRSNLRIAEILAKHVRRHGYRLQRCAQLMGHQVKELFLGFAGALGGFPS